MLTGYEAKLHSQAELKAGKPVQVLEPFAPVIPGVFLYYPGRRQIMPKLPAFITTSAR